MVEEKSKKTNLSLCDATKELISPSAVIWVKLFLIMAQWGCCASYIIFFMKFFEYAFYHSTDIDITHEIVYLCLALCIILPMTLINNMSKFA